MPSARNEPPESRNRARSSGAPAPFGAGPEPARRSDLPVSALVRLHVISAARLGRPEDAADGGGAVRVDARRLPLGRALQHRKMFDATLRAMESAGPEEVRRLEDEEMRGLEMDWFANQIGSLLEETDGRGDCGDERAARGGGVVVVVRVSGDERGAGGRSAAVVPPAAAAPRNAAAAGGRPGVRCCWSGAQAPFPGEPLPAKRPRGRASPRRRACCDDGRPGRPRVSAKNCAGASGARLPQFLLSA